MSLKIPLVLLNVVALLLVFSMPDLEQGMKSSVSVIIVINLVLLLATNPDAKSVTRWGTLISLIGIIAVPISWLILAFGCGIEYYNATCDAFIEPLIYASIGIGFLSLPLSYFVGLFKRS